MDVVVKVVGNVYNATNEQLKQLYLDEDVLMCRQVVGDYYILVEDYRKKIKLHVSDFAGTHSSNFLPRNTVLKLDWDGNVLEVEDTYSSKLFLPLGGVALSRRNSYDRFFETLEEMVKVRFKEDSYVSLSSGADSGCIAAALHSLGKQFKIVTSTTYEDAAVLEERLKFLQGNVDKVVRTIDPKTTKKALTLWNQCASQLGLNFDNQALESLSHFQISKMIPNSTMLSGLGADEFYFRRHDSLLRQFLKAATRAYNHFNLDVRYPLIDPKLYSEYCRLQPKLKRGYKTPLRMYLSHRNFPKIQTDDKYSFVVGQTLL